MEDMKVEPWMLKDFSEIEMEQIKREAAKDGAFLSDEFIIWANNDMPYLQDYIEKLIKAEGEKVYKDLLALYNADHNPDN